MRPILPYGCLLALLACSDGSSPAETVTTGTAPDGLSSEEVIAEHGDATNVSDDAWDALDATLIQLDARTEASGATWSGSTLTLGAGTWRLTGALTGGIRVEATEDALVAVVLDGVDVTNAAGPAFQVGIADDVLLYLADGTVNRMETTASFASTDDAHAALFSDADLTLTGPGTLALTSSDDGLAGDDDLMLRDLGALTIDADDDCLRAQEALVIREGDLDLACGGDGIQADGDAEGDGWLAIEGGVIGVIAGSDGVDAATDVVITGGALTIDAADDGIHAGDVLTIEAGTIDVVGSYEGLEAFTLALVGGDVSLRASDDGINASGGDTTTSGPGGGGDRDGGQEVWITGGRLLVDADGDGLDSNGSLYQVGGEVRVLGPSGSGNGALDTNGTLEVRGGTLVATGSSSMVETPDSSSTQPWIAASLGSRVDASTSIRVLDASGAEVHAFTADKTAQVLVFSSPLLVDGASYTVEVDGTEQATVTEGSGLSGSSGPGGNGGPGGPG